MKNFFRSIPFKILLAVAIILIGIMIGNATFGRGAAFPSSFFSTLAAPFQTVGSILKNGFSGIGDYFSNQQQLMEENDQLREELAALREQFVDYEETKRQNAIYEQMLGIAEKRPDFRMVEALVTVRSSDEYYSELTINKGSMHGIKVKDPVVTSEGVVGYVNEVGLNYAKITTLFSPEANVGGYDITTHDYGVITGSAELISQGQFKLTYLPKDSLISVGNIITTSGLGGTFPAGLVVGIVSKVTNANQGVSLEAVLTPTADFTSLSEVIIITSFEMSEMPADSAQTASQQSTESAVSVAPEAQ